MKSSPLFLILPVLALPACTMMRSSDPSSVIPLVADEGSSFSYNAVTTTTPPSSGPQSLTLASLPGKIRTHNPELAAARILIQEAQARVSQAGRASNPELGVEFEADRHFRDLMLTVGIDQRFPRTNKLALEKQISQTLVRAAAAEVADAERQLIGKARRALIEILAIRAEKKLIQAQEANARELATFIKEAAARGEASPLGAGTALIEAVRLQNQARQIGIREQLAVATLKPLFGMQPSASLEIAGTLPPATLPPMLVAASNRPDLQAAHLRAQSAAETTSLEQAKKYEDFEAGIFAGVGREEDLPEGLEAEQIIGVRLKIPLPLNNDNSGAVAEASARQRRLTMEANTLNQSILSEAKAAYQEMTQWSALAGEIKSGLIPMAEKQITQTRASYDKGEVPLQDVLRAQEQKLSLETAHLEALRDFHFALTNYLTATARY